MASAIRVTGLREAIDRLEGFEGDLEALRAAHDDLAQDIARRAAGLVPVATGALRATIRAVPTDGKAVVVAGSASVDYALVQDRRTGFLLTPGNDTETARAAIEAGIEQLAQDHRLT